MIENPNTPPDEPTIHASSVPDDGYGKEKLIASFRKQRKLPISELKKIVDLIDPESTITGYWTAKLSAEDEKAGLHGFAIELPAELIFQVLGTK